MCSGLRLLVVLTITFSVICIVTSKSKHGHKIKKSHGPLRPVEKKIHHGRAKVRSHGANHHHFKKTVHVSHHVKHKHHLKHRHQPMLHLKAHKKGVTFAKSPAEPQACIDFLPCLQYRYYHCRSHEWIRNNCPKLCLYCEHQPFPEPMYGRFKTVAASYPDWCLDHSQCVAYPTEACTYDEWMRLNCLRKCDVCFKDKKVKAGILFVGPPFDQTEDQKKEEHQLNKILHFRPTPPPAKDKDSKFNFDKENTSNKTAPADKPAEAVKDKPNFQPPNALVDTPSEANKDKPNFQPPTALTDLPAEANKDKPNFQPPTALTDLPVEANIDKPNFQPPTALTDLPAEAMKDKPNFQPPKTLTYTPAKPILPQSPDLPDVNAPAFSPKPKAKTPIGMPAYSYEDLMKQELKAAKDAPSTKQFKADVLKQVQIKLKSGRFPQINTAHVFVKHEVTKPKRKHVVESGSTPKHKVLKPTHAKQQENKAVKHLKDEEKAAKSHKGKSASGKKRQSKISKKTEASKKSTKKVAKSHKAKAGKKSAKKTAKSHKDEAGKKSKTRHGKH